MKKLIIFLLCLAVLGGGGFFGYKKYQKNKEETTFVDVVPVSMMAQPAEYFNYQNEDMGGRITAANAQKIYVDTGKLVQNVLVKKGDMVKKGDTILEYDMTVVELELAQKENKVKLTEQKIKMAKKELEEIKNYKPSEDAPQPDYPDEPDYPDFPDYPVFPDDPEPPVPIVLAEEVSGSTPPASGSGTAEDPFIVNCGRKTIVRKNFLSAIGSGRRIAELHVYDEETQTFLFKWIIDGSKMTQMDAVLDFPVMDGMTFDEKTCSVSVNADAKMHGQLSFTPPVQENTDEFPDDELPDDFGMMEMPEESFEEPVFNENDPQSNDYVYTRKRIQEMVREKQNEIKQLELDLKNAELELKNARKQKSDGKVVAAVDGVVKKIGQAAGESDEETEETDPFAAPSEDDNAFAIIEGAGGVEVVFDVAELNLPKVPVGTAVDVMSYMNGAFSTATVTSVESEPSSYSVNDPWSNNPQNSSYRVHASIDDAEDFVVGNYVSVTLQNTPTDDSGAVIMPAHYVRQENGDYYIMKQNDEGRLVKQYVRAGRVLWSGEMIEITGGLDMNDKICFPYGQNVREGVRTNETTEVLYPGMG